ncbi:D-2-hydroxyacid dehydrogenase [Marinagarivorans algicola]|uniref:D-2-hydroxyacid dehydrogenase n=1 Tax=Marinagarivorans algicola TaxID=1513270 RepID=UPI0006B4E899|nr:D-2-hydroxyacid dehydrogenase [Marinagarivorans algicola]
MHKITFLDHSTFPPNITFTPPRFRHQWQSYDTTAPTQTAKHLQGATFAITNKVVIDEAILSQCPTLQYIAVAATGFNIVDIAACKKRNIVVTNITDYATHSVAEHVFMLMLALNKQLKNYTQALEAGQWQQSEQFCFFLDGGIHTLRGKTLGLIGTGAIAMATASLAHAFGMEVIFYSPSGREAVGNNACVSLPVLLERSDVVSVHCPLTSDTQHLINPHTLKLMKPSALLINTARGPIVDEAAVIAALQRKQLAGAGLDVVAQEPPRANSSVMQALKHPGLIITPHVAWASQTAMQALANQLMQKIEDYVAGKPVVNLAQ